MIIRLSRKLATKIKADKLPEMRLRANKISDWSAHVFIANRKQYILLCNTSSFYSCLTLGKGVTTVESFVQRAFDTIGEFMNDDGQSLAFEQLIAPSRNSIRFAKALNRSVIGSMNDHVQASKFHLEDGMLPQEIGHRLNQTPLSALRDNTGRNYGNPRDVFETLVADQRGQAAIDQTSSYNS